MYRTRPEHQITQSIHLYFRREPIEQRTQNTIKKVINHSEFFNVAKTAIAIPKSTVAWIPPSSFNSQMKYK